MAKIISMNEHFQHFLSELKESFWGDLYGQTRQSWQRFFGAIQAGLKNIAPHRSGVGTVRTQSKRQ